MSFQFTICTGNDCPSKSVCSHHAPHTSRFQHFAALWARREAGANACDCFAGKLPSTFDAKPYQPNGSEPLPLEFRFVEFNFRRHMRGAEAARVAVIDGEDETLLWMSRSDILGNIEDHGPHPELKKALAFYGGGK